MIKAGDYLYCHSDAWHNLNRFLYDRESVLVFKAGEKYFVFDVQGHDTNDPYIALYGEDETLQLVSYYGKDRHDCHRKRLWTISELRERKLNNLLHD